MATYGKAGEKVRLLCAEVLDRFHPDLVKSKASIEILFAYPSVDRDGESPRPAMMTRGLRILARVKINAEEARCAGAPDATITLDAAHWKTLDEEGEEGLRKQEALLDHELYHLVCREKDGDFVLDDQGRPKLQSRPHDWEVTGFRAVADRHRQFAPEVIVARQFHDRFGNLLFCFAEDLAVDEYHGKPAETGLDQEDQTGQEAADDEELTELDQEEQERIPAQPKRSRASKGSKPSRAKKPKVAAQTV